MDAKEAIQKYWPWALGAVAGIYLITRKGGSAPSNAPVYLQAGASDAQIMASAQAEALRQQTELQNRQLSLAEQKQANELQLQRDALELQSKIAADEAKSANLLAAGGFLKAQGEAGATAAAGTAAMLSALYGPGNAAMQGAAQENAAALQAGALAAMGAYQAQAESFKGVTGVLQEFTKIPQSGMAAIGQLGQNKPPSAFEQITKAMDTYGKYGGFL